MFNILYIFHAFLLDGKEREKKVISFFIMVDVFEIDWKSIWMGMTLLHTLFWVVSVLDFIVLIDRLDR